jgi:hypothetical protein
MSSLKEVLTNAHANTEGDHLVNEVAGLRRHHQQTSQEL